VNKCVAKDMSGSIVIRKSDGMYRTEPSNTSIVEADGGVYISYDIDASETEYKFEKGAEIVGVYYGDLEHIDDPSDGESWSSDMIEQFRG
jgi:hypothetical protein